MISIKSSGTFTGAGALSAIAASLCCITPVIALLAGSSSIAANFSWIEPARPYLIGLSIVVLVFAWYLKLNQLKQMIEIVIAKQLRRFHSFNPEFFWE